MTEAWSVRAVKALLLAAHDFSSLRAAATSVFATSKGGGLEFTRQFARLLIALTG